MTTRVLRYWETVRHLHGAQLLSRVRLRIAARARRTWPNAASRLIDRRVARAEVVWRDDLLGAEALDAILSLRKRDKEPDVRLEDVGAGRFRCLDETAELGSPPNWAAPNASQLWRYHLHYFEWLPALEAPAQAMPLVEHWIQSNPIHGNGATPDAWHPYVASLRMVNWMLAFSRMGGARGLSDEIRLSLLTHALFLERNLETDVGGNHLLKNLKALAIAGCFWNGPAADEWRRTFAQTFTSELSRQVLADGGHYERSPMYHCQVMADAIELAAVLASRGSDDAELLRLIGRMDNFLRLVTHPDGQIALFNDSAFGMAPAPAALHRAADAVRRTSGSTSHAGQFPERSQAAVASGYVPLPSHDAAKYLLADVGMVCPDELPAHAHADLLSFELSLDGVRMLVDSGVGEYAAGPWRDYYRSTRAHNTVSVDGHEQSDCWSSFRVGRRARPANVAFTENVTGDVLDAEHTGFDHLSVRHRRRFEWSGAGGFWTVDDTLSGSGRHSWTSFCHFHPEATIDVHSDWARAARDGRVLDICWYGFDSARVVRGKLDPPQGWYAERFGPPLPGIVLVLEGRRTLPAAFGYALVPQASMDAPRPAVTVEANRIAVVRNTHA